MQQQIGTDSVMRCDTPVFFSCALNVYVNINTSKYPVWFVDSTSGGSLYWETNTCTLPKEISAAYCFSS